MLAGAPALPAVGGQAGVRTGEWELGSLAAGSVAGMCTGPSLSYKE